MRIGFIGVSNMFLEERQDIILSMLARDGKV
ncbi:MAG TPA: DeoR/GlpR transcriptional regulator, partial [Mitsuokella multacida]|nr:DeoR/GlpR transcriptional regulator [Mitsuokella multacida]